MSRLQGKENVYVRKKKIVLAQTDRPAPICARKLTLGLESAEAHFHPDAAVGEAASVKVALDKIRYHRRLIDEIVREPRRDGKTTFLGDNLQGTE